MSDDKKLVLASKSPRRRELLNRLGIVPILATADVDETFIPGALAGNEAMRLAMLKAKAISLEHPGAYVLAADTIVAKDTELLGKPSDVEDALQMLTLLEDTTHSVFTGCAIVSLNEAHEDQFVVETKVRFKKSSQEELLGYCQTQEPFDKAGGYGIQGIGAFLVSSIQGSYTNVVGLPLAEVCDRLIDLGIWSPNLLPKEQS